MPDRSDPANPLIIYDIALEPEVAVSKDKRDLLRLPIKQPRYYAFQVYLQPGFLAFI